MNTIAKVREPEQQSLPAIPNEQPSMLDIISRAARDPDVDVTKLERLMVMAREERAAQAKQAFGVAMMDAQEEMGPVRTDANNKATSSKYATYGALDRVIRPIYTKHGFALTFDTGEGAPSDYVRVVCEVFHRAGHTRNYHFDMPADGKGAKGGDVMTRTHAAGSAMTYGQRYLLKAIFNIVVGDDDGNAASGNGPIGQDDLRALQELIDAYSEHGANAVLLCKYFKVDALPDLRAPQYRKAVEMLNFKYAGKKKVNP